MLTLTLDIRQVEANGTIYIRADGSIDPPTAPISTVEDIKYTFISDINDSIVVERDNIVVEGAGYTLHGRGAGYGIYLSYRNNVTLQTIRITNFICGIKLHYSTNNALIGNTVSGNDLGIELCYSSDNTLIRNTVSSSTQYGIRLLHSSGNALFGNKAFSTNIYGILLSYSSGNSLVGNNVSSNIDGIRVASSSDNNVLAGNNVSRNVRGLHVCYSSGNSLVGNNASNNGDGFRLWSSKNNTLAGNYALNNDDGIHLEASSSNTIFHNNLIDNALQACVTVGYANIWNNGVEGNYWSDDTGIDVNHDGIGDIQYEIDSGNVDHYPLMGMFHSFNISSDRYVNVISNCNIEDFEYFESENRIEMQVLNSSVNQKYGFCRVRLPKDMFGPNFTVIIDGGATETLHFNDAIHDTDTHAWIYFAYVNPTHRLIIQTSSREADSFPTWIAIVIILIAVVGTALLIYFTKIRKTTQK